MHFYIDPNFDTLEIVSLVRIQSKALYNNDHSSNILNSKYTTIKLKERFPEEGDEFT